MSDPSSLSNASELVTESLELALRADFGGRVLVGHVDLALRALADGVTSVVLDTRDLDVRGAALRGDSDTELAFEIGASVKSFGSPLRIALPKALAAGDVITLRVQYATTPQSSAIQWLEPSQTAGKKHPYLFTQCQAIHCRALIPCQDSPQCKAPYRASITVPAPLVAVMSAICTGSEATGDAITYHFHQKNLIPTYLIALAVGALVSREIGPRSSVYCEPEMIDAAAYEFCDTERFLSTAEEILTPYEWGRYDLLVMPPSFPYGGMENPNLTFVTPTLISGDRSQANVIAHEISHSWAGNLVTNRTWEHFWLNEGMTVFIERKILGRMYGRDMFDFHMRLGWGELQDDVQEFGADHEFTTLNVQLDGVDPDDAFSKVPYEKGFFFLYYLQSLVGGDAKFEPFLKAYFTKYTNKTVTSQMFKEDFLAFFAGTPGLDAIDWETWLRKPGMPQHKPAMAGKYAAAVQALVDKWSSGNIDECRFKDIADFEPIQIVAFLDSILLSTPLPTQQAVKRMDSVYQFTQSRNSEIRLRWQQLCLKVKDRDIIPHVVQFVSEVGRMKYVRPLFRELVKLDRELAQSTFRQLRSQYHAITQKMLARDLGLEQQ